MCFKHQKYPSFSLSGVHYLLQSASGYPVRKNVPVFQEGGSTLAPLTPPVIRVVLLHTERFEESFNYPNLRMYYFLKNEFFFVKLDTP